MAIICHQLFRAGTVLALAAGLAACQGMEKKVQPGTPLAAVEAEYGRPDFTCTRPDGRQRVIWTLQPNGQYAWGTDVNGDGRIVRMEALLTDEHFRRLGTGTWTPDQVQCEFGPPAQIDEVGLPSVRQVVWSYRYKQDDVWFSLMYVYFGHDGSHVTNFHPGPDPRYEGDHFDND